MRSRVARGREVPRRKSFWPAARFHIETRRSGLEKRSMANPFEFLQQVRAEGEKVTWPSRRETMITTGLVLLMVFVVSLFFLAVDEILHFVIGYALGIGRHG
jgi:preprotein translocase subunit SecE